MKNVKEKSQSTGDPGFDKLIKRAGHRNRREVNLADLMHTFQSAKPSAAQLKEARDCYQTYQDVIDAAMEAGEKLMASPEGQAKIKEIERILKNEDSDQNAVPLVKELTEMAEMDHVVSLAYTTGIKAIGVGVAASFSLICIGAEAGVEGIYLLPSANSHDPNMLTSRSWKSGTVGIDFIASAGFNFSFWFTPPTNEIIGGTVVDLVIGLGARLSIIKTGERPEKIERPFNPDLTLSGFSIRLSVGLEIGAAKYLGGQKVPAYSKLFPNLPDDEKLMTLYILNAATGTNVIEMGQETTLNGSIIAPSGGENTPVMLQTGQTKLTLLMPEFLQDDVDAMSISMVNWVPTTSPTYGALQMTYQGPDNQPWEAQLLFEITGVRSSSTTADTSPARLTMDGVKLTANCMMELAPLVFNADIAWNVTTGSGISVVEGMPDGDTGVPVTTPPDNFQQLTQFVDTNTRNDTTWNCGYVFQPQDKNGTIVPMMQAIIWKDGSSWQSGTKYVSTPWVEVTASPQTMTAYYNDTTSTTLVITVALA